MKKGNVVEEKVKNCLERNPEDLPSPYFLYTSTLSLDKLPEDYFRFNYVDDPDLKLILDAFHIQIPKKLFRRADLKKLKTDISFST